MTTNEIKAVRVFSGDGRVCIGKGVLVGYVTVYAVKNPDGSLQSMNNAEIPPLGVNYETIENNPKIVMMEDGKVFYGCQVWWEPWVDEFTAVENEDGSAQILSPDGKVLMTVQSDASWRTFTPLQIAGVAAIYFNEAEEYMCKKDAQRGV